ncbi:MAG: Phage protein [uncultured Paraburkholderia sp.]|nr:MAG: Phage protein [uncultured Paraburkholderia sp.]
MEARKELALLQRVTHGSSEHPLRIGDIEIPCYVLEDGTRVLSQRGLQTGIGMSVSGGSKSGEQRLVSFLASLAEKTNENKDLSSRIGAIATRLRAPLKFRLQTGVPAFGFEATILADICDAVLAARQEGVLQSQQSHIAEQCEILVRGFARVGIIALVDEATGYQKDRERDALAQILEKFVAKELQPYVKTFPSDYYEELFRLRGLKYPPENPKFRPQYFGLLTNDIVYGRLAPGLLEELKALSKSDERKAHLHRRLTQDIGHPKLREHLASVVTIMKLSDKYPDFISKLNRIHQRFGKTIPLDLEEEDRG